MIRNLLTTTAFATLVTTSAYAQQDSAAPTKAPSETAQPADPKVEQATAKSDGHLATNIIGEKVYNGTGDNAVNIGDVNDIVIDEDSRVKAVVIGVGGFLGIGEKNVAIDFAKLKWAQGNGDRWLVTDASKEQLQSLPSFDRSIYDPAPTPVASNDPAAPADAAPADGTTAKEPRVAPADKSAADSPDATTTAAIDKSTLSEVPSGKLSAEDLVGTTVYGANDENIGEIGDIVLSKDGKVDAIVIDVGGFLGMGEKPVAVGFDKLAFMTDNDGNKYLYTTLTKEQLEAQPGYEKGTYSEKRDQQRLIVQ